jgi:hypothetical protein
MEVDISGGKTTGDATLTASAENLGEVIVSTGYGTRKVKEATGSVAAVTTKDFNRGVISTPETIIPGDVRRGLLLLHQVESLVQQLPLISGVHLQ